MGFRGQMRRAGIETANGNFDVFNGEFAVRGVPFEPWPMLDTNGHVFWLDPTGGDDDHDGSRKAPFKTLATAVAACTSGNGDVIVRMPGTEQTTALVTLDVAGLTIISSMYGMNPYQPEKFLTYTASTYTTGPVIKITQPCALIGLEFETRHTTGPTILVDGEGGGFTGGFFWIKNCRFPAWFTGSGHTAIKFSAGAYARIETCYFDGAFTYGINFTGSLSNNPDYVDIVGCTFRGVTKAINLATTTHHFCVDRCIFADIGTDALTTGGNASTGDGLLIDNYFDCADIAAATDKANYAALAAIGIYAIGNHFRAAD